MNEHRNYIQKFRISNDVDILNGYKCNLEDYSDINFDNRKELILELYGNYNEADKPLMKWLMNQEYEGFQGDIPVETLEICAFMLYKLMENEDIFDLYEAKFGTGSDIQMKIDPELIFGFSPKETIRYLNNHKNEDSAFIIEDIKRYQSNEKAKFKTRDAYIKYFEDKKMKFILSDLEDFQYS